MKVTDAHQSLIGTFSTLRRCVVFGRLLHKFFNVQNSSKRFLSVSITSFVCFSLEFLKTSSLSSLLCFFFLRRLEVLELLNSSNFLIFFILFFGQCSISSSYDIDSALSVSVSCNKSVAILTLLEAVLQHFCSSTLCLQQGKGSTLDPLFRQKLLWRHNVTSSTSLLSPFHYIHSS